MRLFEGRIYFNVNYFRRFLERVPGIPPDIFDLLLFGDMGQVTFPRPPLSWRLVKVAVLIARTWRRALERMDCFIDRLGARLGRSRRSSSARSRTRGCWRTSSAWRRSSRRASTCTCSARPWPAGTTSSSRSS